MEDIIIDNDGCELARVIYDWNDEWAIFLGYLIEIEFPESLRSLFVSYENDVNSGVFAKLDDYEEQISSYQLALKKRQVLLVDVQVMNSNQICFRLSETINEK